MVDLSNYPYPAYESNKIAASILAFFIAISLIAWIVQSIRSHFKPRRLLILILISHLIVIVELVLLAALSTGTRNSRTAFAATIVLLAVGQRMIVLANYNFLTEVGDRKWCVSRAINIGALVGAIGSGILMAPAGTLSYHTGTIDTSFRLRQASAGIFLCLTVLFYPIWYATKTAKHMTKQAIVLLIISSVTCLIVAVFLMITSVPDYYVGASQEESWFYVFQLTPIAIALCTWTILHPNRSLVSTQQPREDTQQQIDDIL